MSFWHWLFGSNSLWGKLFYSGHRKPNPPTVPPTPADPPVVTVPPEPVPVVPPFVGPINIRGKFFYNGDTRIRLQGISLFHGLRDYIHGTDIRPYLSWARALGANYVRVFSRLAWSPLKETDYTDEQLLAFVRFLATEGFAVEIVALADCRDYPGYEMTLDQMRAHVERLARVIGKEPNVILELVNEPEFNIQGHSVFDFDKPTQGIWSRGSAMFQSLRDTIPPWDYVTMHEPRDFDGNDPWPGAGRQAKFIADKYNVPTLLDEPVEIGSDYKPGQRSNVVQDHSDQHACAALYIAGSLIHSYSLLAEPDEGFSPHVPTGREQECAEAIAHAWTVIPITAPDGVYTRGGLSECPLEHDDATCFRTYCQLFGNTALAVRIRATTPAVARNGWKIDTIDGHIVTLSY